MSAASQAEREFQAWARDELTALSERVDQLERQLGFVASAVPDSAGLDPVTLANLARIAESA